MRKLLIAWAAAAVLAGCGPSGTPGAAGTGDPSPSPEASVSAELQCAPDNEYREDGVLDYDHEAVGKGQDPVRVVRDFLGTHAAEDRLSEVQAPGPPGSRAVVAVEREGSVVALVHVVTAPGGGGFLVGG